MSKSVSRSLSKCMGKSVSRYVPWRSEQFVSRSASASQCVIMSESKDMSTSVSRSLSKCGGKSVSR